MSEFFKSQDYGRIIYKHIDLPIYITDEFNFYRCVNFNDHFYGMTVSELHNGNLRLCNGRYAKLFPNQKLSYWANSPNAARAEIKKHGAGNNILTFWAYDDATSTFPCLLDQTPLVIVDGRKCGIQELIDKADRENELTKEEVIYLQQIVNEQPDCLVYDSHAYDSGENFIFFEKGFKKLAIKQMRLRLGDKTGKNHNIICCADTCDYIPRLENYGKFFAPIAKVGMCEDYLQDNEYLIRRKVLEDSYKQYREAMDE